MPLQSSLISLTEGLITLVLPAAGVYALWAQEELVYYGWADATTGLRRALESHLGDAAPPCTGRATHFQIEFASLILTPRERCDQLLWEYFRATGRYPPCNLPRGPVPIKPANAGMDRPRRGPH